MCVKTKSLSTGAKHVRSSSKHCKFAIYNLFFSQGSCSLECRDGHNCQEVILMRDTLNAEKKASDLGAGRNRTGGENSENDDDPDAVKLSRRALEQLSKTITCVCSKCVH